MQAIFSQFFAQKFYTENTNKNSESNLTNIVTLKMRLHWSASTSFTVSAF